MSQAAGVRIPKLSDFHASAVSCGLSSCHPFTYSATTAGVSPQSEISSTNVPSANPPPSRICWNRRFQSLRGLHPHHQNHPSKNNKRNEFNNRTPVPRMWGVLHHPLRSRLARMPPLQPDRSRLQTSGPVPRPTLGFPVCRRRGTGGGAAGLISQGARLRALTRRANTSDAHTRSARRSCPSGSYTSTAAGDSPARPAHFTACVRTSLGYSVRSCCS
jgi:hypothetical protein